MLQIEVERDAACGSDDGRPAHDERADDERSADDENAPWHGYLGPGTLQAVKIGRSFMKIIWLPP